MSQSASTTVSTPAPPAPMSLLVRLWVMMFLQYAIQGAWLPLLFGFFTIFRGMPGPQVGWIVAAGAIGAVVSPFIAGQLADRYLNAEKFLFLSHLVGAGVVLTLGEVTNLYVLVGISFVYGVLYTPTLAVTNAVAFAHLPDRDRDFGYVRVFGTFGFIVAGIFMGQWLLHVHTPSGATKDAVEFTQAKGIVDAFRLSALLGVVQAFYCLTLPKTPPRREVKSYAPGEALLEVRRQPLITIFLISFPIAAVHSFFFARTAEYLIRHPIDVGWIEKIFGVGGGPMTIGQISELIVLPLMPLFIKRVPRKVLLTIGLLAYAARFAVFAYLPYSWALVPALALHGIVFGGFFFLCYMLVDEQTTTDVRASAQNLFNLVVFGAGVILGNLLAGWVEAWTSVDGKMNWSAFYAFPMWITLACLVALLIFYPNRPIPPPERRGFQPVLR